MIKVIDIQNHIAKRLKDNFPTHNVYVEDNREKMRVPAFSISVRPLTSTNYMKYRTRLINVDIAYLSEKRTHTENLLMSEQLSNLFYLMLRVYDRKPKIGDITIREVDTVLYFGFTLEFNEDVTIKYDPERDTDLGYDEGSVEYMRILQLRDTEGNDY